MLGQMNRDYYGWENPKNLASGNMLNWYVIVYVRIHIYINTCIYLLFVKFILNTMQVCKTSDLNGLGRRVDTNGPTPII